MADRPPPAAQSRSLATGLANTLSRASPAGRGGGRTAPPTERQIRVAIHKKCVIWLTITPVHQAIDVSDKSACDQGRQLTESVVIDLLLVRNGGVS